MSGSDLIKRQDVIDLIEGKMKGGFFKNSVEDLECDSLIEEISDLPKAYDTQAVIETLDAIKSLAEKHAKTMSMEVKASNECPWLKNKVCLKAIGTHELERIIKSVEEQAEIVSKLSDIAEQVHTKVVKAGYSSTIQPLSEKKDLMASFKCENFIETYLEFSVVDKSTSKELLVFRIVYPSSEQDIKNALENFLLLGEKVNSLTIESTQNIDTKSEERDI